MLKRLLRSNQIKNSKKFLKKIKQLRKSYFHQRCFREITELKEILIQFQ